MIFENEQIFIRYRNQFIRLFNLIIIIKNKKFFDKISKIYIEDVNKVVEFIENNQTNNISFNPFFKNIKKTLMLSFFN